MRPFHSRLQRETLAVRASIDILGKFAIGSGSGRSADSVWTWADFAADRGVGRERGRQCSNSTDGFAQQGKRS